jgi:hypothetical protein
MTTFFVDPETLVRYLHGTGVRVIRHTVTLDGETVDLLTCQLPDQPDDQWTEVVGLETTKKEDRLQADNADLHRRLDKSNARTEELEKMLTARVTAAELRKVSGEWGQDKEDPKGET